MNILAIHDTFLSDMHLASLKDDGIAAILVPMGALFSSGSTGSIRQKLVDDNYIEAIIEFPKNMLFPYAVCCNSFGYI